MGDIQTLQGSKNPYDELVPGAIEELGHILHFSDDVKMRMKAAEDIIAQSSYGKQQEVQPTIVITNSHVQLLLQTMKEVANG